MTVIDAHHHLWTADYAWLAAPQFAPIRRDYDTADLAERTSDAGVSHTILVEAASQDPGETERFLDLAAATPQIIGVVGWVSLSDRTHRAVLQRYRRHPHSRYLVGLRDQIQGQPDPAYLDRPDVLAALADIERAGLVFDLVVRPDQLPAATRAAAALPGLTFVLDHLGKPAIREAATRFEPWRTRLAELARCPNVVAKLSGLVTEADWVQWSADDLRPFVETAIELFGHDRLMFGSDWPVCELAAGYRQVKDTLVEILGGQASQIFAGTAIGTYGVDPSV